MYTETRGGVRLELKWRGTWDCGSHIINCKCNSSTDWKVQRHKGPRRRRRTVHENRKAAWSVVVPARERKHWYFIVKVTKIPQLDFPTDYSRLHQLSLIGCVQSVPVWFTRHGDSGWLSGSHAIGKAGVCIFYVLCEIAILLNYVKVQYLVKSIINVMRNKVLRSENLIAKNSEIDSVSQALPSHIAVWILH